MPEVTPIQSMEEFQKAINPDDETFAIIDFWATWCGPCRVVSPKFEELAAEDTSGKAKYYKIDIDHAQQIASMAGIKAVPTFTIYRKGAPVETLCGANINLVKDMVQKHLSA